MENFIKKEIRKKNRGFGCYSKTPQGGGRQDNTVRWSFESTKVRSSIAALPIGMTSSSLLGVTKAADMLGEVARKAVDFLRECKNLAHTPAGRVETGAGDGIFRYCAAAAAPDRGRQRSDGVFGEAKSLADLADRLGPR